MGGVQPVKMGGVFIGDGYPTVFMAEIGTFFNQDLNIALEWLQKIAASGAQLFKTEILHDPNVCVKGSGLTTTYQHAGGQFTEDYRALIERKVIPLADYAKLFAACRELKIPFVCSVYDVQGVDFLAEQGGAGIKIARDNMNNVALLRHAGRTGLPIILDAGDLYFSEVARAVETVKTAGTSGVIVNHHPAANPAPAKVHHLRIIETYKKALGCPIGLSCHYRGEEILYVAVGCGVNLVEKGVATDPDTIEQDLVSAVSLERLPKVVKRLRACWDSLGSERWTVSEARNTDSWKSFVAVNDISKGDVLSLGNIGFAFPPVGIDVSHWDIIQGRRAARAVKKGMPIHWSDIDLENSE